MGHGYAVTAGYDRMLALWDAAVVVRNVAVSIKGRKKLVKKNFITAKNAASGPVWTSGPKVIAGERTAPPRHPASSATPVCALPFTPWPRGTAFPTQQNQHGFHGARILAMAASSHAKQVVTASADNKMKMFDVDSGVCVKTFEGCKAWVSCVAVCGEVSGGDWTEMVANGKSKGKCPWKLQNRALNRIWGAMFTHHTKLTVSREGSRYGASDGETLEEEREADAGGLQGDTRGKRRAVSMVRGCGLHCRAGTRAQGRSLALGPLVVLDNSTGAFELQYGQCNGR